MTKKKTKTPKQPKNAAPKPNGVKIPVVITMLLDESGSMSSLWDSTIAGFNEYVNKSRLELKDVDAYFSAIKFDTAGVRKLQVGAQIKDAIELTKLNYTPNGGTPLLDAVAKTILATDEIVRDKGASRVIVVVQTDGHENASREYNRAQVKVMVEERSAKGWVFLFLGAGIDAFAEASTMGFAQVNTVSYGNDATTNQQMYQTLSGKTASYANTADLGVAVASASFNAGDRALLKESETLAKVRKTTQTTTDYSLKDTP